ncbi:hypothetical protein niasHS_015204 [Heterodera schachtii]|uniref:Uncharacterized protein n=1 Tax=Heterodera schachtii TaxID=97005 RepID=A0ABD2I1I1_HETSC
MPPIATERSFFSNLFVQATLASVANLKPVKGTADQFTFPASINFLYVSKTHKAKLTVKGDGEAKVTVLDAKAAHSPKKCKTSKF